MLTKLYSIRSSAWIILALLTILAALSATIRSTGFVSSQVFMHALQPASALFIAALAHILTRNKRPVARRIEGKAFLVGSVLALWLVLYFLSGLIFTYVHNSLFTNIRGLLLNLWQFGITAAAIEYSRYALIKLISRRNLLWFGTILSCVLALQQINFGQLQNVHNLTELIQLCVADFIPSIFASFILTYLAITSGLVATLIYRLGLIATFVLLPIIPKLDWYMQGISLILLAILIYVVLDRNNRADIQHPYRSHNHGRTFEIIWISGIVALACFMTGVFRYRPYAIPTNSMSPSYSRGAMVMVEKVNNPLDIKVGDIVQYKTTNKLVTHRVLAINSDGSGKRVFIVKGDNNPTPDVPIVHNQIIGVVRADVPYLGYPTVWLMDLSQGGR